MLLFSDDCPSDPQWSSQMSSAEAGQEGHYDVLPIKNSMTKNFLEIVKLSQ